jgi:putative FmdB family regulatory protein
MPIFTYLCRSCGKKQDILVLPGEKEPVKCTYCGGSLKKIPATLGGLQFKGSGFYITDYAKKGKKPSGSKSED